jgi:HK97 family phage portal protein
MGLWRGLFEQKDARPGDSAAATTRAVSTIGRSSFAAQAVDHDNVTQAVEGHYKRVLWVWRAIDAIALAQCTLQLRTWTDRTDEAELVDGWDHIERLLNVRPNKYEQAWQFRYRISTLMLLSSMGVFIEIVPDAITGDPAELHIIAPDAVSPIKDPKKFVTGYRVRTIDGFRDLPPEKVIWMRGRPHPTDAYRQVTPLQAAGLSADTDWLAHLFNNNWLKNDGRPGLLISVGNDVGPEDADELKRRFGGHSRAGETSVIQSEQVSVNDLGGNPRDAQYVETLNGTKQEILMAFGVAETFLSWANGRTYDNADAEIEIVWETTMRSHCLMIGSGFDYLVNPDRDPKAPIIAHDLSKVAVLQRAKRTKDEAAMQHFSAGLLTIDEMREQLGREPFNVAQSKAAWMPSGLMSVAPDDATEKEINKKLQDGQLTPPIDPNNAIAPPAPAGGAPGPRKGTGSAPAGKGRATPASSAQVTALAKTIRRQINDNAAREVRQGSTPRAIQSAKARLQRVETKDEEPEREVLEGEIVTCDQEMIDAHAAAVSETLTAWGADLVQVCQYRVGSVKARRGTRHWEPAPEQKASYQPERQLNAFYVAQVDRWVDEITYQVRSMIRQAASEAMHQVRVDLDVDAEGIMRASKLVRDLVNRLANDLEKGVAKRVREVQQLIRRMDRDGADIDAIKAAIFERQYAIDGWAATVAPRLVRAAVQGARAILADRVPDSRVMKVWRSMDDHRVRRSHVEADGQAVKRGTSFVVNGHRMAAPGDPRAPASEWANCRCRISFRRPDGSEF